MSEVRISSLEEVATLFRRVFSEILGVSGSVRILSRADVNFVKPADFFVEEEETVIYIEKDTRVLFLIAPHCNYNFQRYIIWVLIYFQIWVQNSFLEELSKLVKSFYYDESEDSGRDEGERRQHENSSADPAEKSFERDSRLNTLNNYLTWRAIQPFISYLGKGSFKFKSDNNREIIISIFSQKISRESRGRSWRRCRGPSGRRTGGGRACWPLA